MNDPTLPHDELFAELIDIYDVRALRRYGLSRINQLMHAVQSGAHARAQDLSPSLVVACLLHDVGHMVHDLGEHPAAAGIDDRHEDVGADWLATFFPASVSEPVRLHVAAKRYLCAKEPDYFSQLSRDSVESLALQGGPMSADEVQEFEQRPFWREAVALRRIDELAKEHDGPMPPFGSFWTEIDTVLRETARA